MSDYIKRIRTSTGDKQIDYTALANLPTIPNPVDLDTTLTQTGKAADAKIVGDKLDLVNSSISEINDKIEDIMYVAVEITSFSNDINIVEIGSTVNSVNLNWVINKMPITLMLDGTEIDAASTTKELTSLNLGTDKTWTLQATDEREAVSQKTTSVKFYNGVYYGVAVVPETYDSNFIKTLNKTLTNSKSKTINITASTNEYIYYCVPVRLGDCSFNVGGFDGGFTKVSTIQFVNSSDYTEDYDIYKSDNVNLGSTTVKVS